MKRRGFFKTAALAGVMIAAGLIGQTARAADTIKVSLWGRFRTMICHVAHELAQQRFGFGRCTRAVDDESVSNVGFTGESHRGPLGHRRHGVGNVNHPVF